MTETDRIDDSEVAAFRQRFKPREVRGVTVLVVDPPGCEGAVLDIGVRQIIGATGNRGFVCDVGGLASVDLDTGLGEIVRCYSTIVRAGGALCYLGARRFIDYNANVAKCGPLPQPLKMKPVL